MLPLELKIAVTNPDAVDVLFIWCWFAVAVLQDRRSEGWRKWLHKVEGLILHHDAQANMQAVRKGAGTRRRNRLPFLR